MQCILRRGRVIYLETYSRSIFFFLEYIEGEEFRFEQCYLHSTYIVYRSGKTLSNRVCFGATASSCRYWLLYTLIADSRCYYSSIIDIGIAMVSMAGILHFEIGDTRLSFATHNRFFGERNFNKLK